MTKQNKNIKIKYIVFCLQESGWTTVGEAPTVGKAEEIADKLKTILPTQIWKESRISTKEVAYPIPKTVEDKQIEDAIVFLESKGRIKNGRIVI